jgi:hypothetical protein
MLAFAMTVAGLLIIHQIDSELKNGNNNNSIVPERGTSGFSPSPSHLCPIEDLKVGHWVNVTYDAVPYIGPPGKACPGLKPNEIYHTWRWEPKSVKSKGCRFTGFSNHSYCDLMSNKTVAIIGDSISLDHYLSLTHLLGVPKPLPKFKAGDASGDALLVSRVCQNSSTLIGKRDFYLHSIKKVVDNHFPDVLVLNRGAHYVPDDQLIGDMHRTIFPQLEDWQNACRLKNKDCVLIWRTTVPGHPNCRNYTEPTNSVDEMEELLRNASVHGWEKFAGQNELVLNALQHTNLSYEVMDAYHVNILRPDLHNNPQSRNDCLHTVRHIQHANVSSMRMRACHDLDNQI